MNPPPPMLPALGCVTASANAVATAASTALPPLFRIAAPTSEAGADVVITIPSRDVTGGDSVCCAAACVPYVTAKPSGTARIQNERPVRSITTSRWWRRDASSRRVCDWKNLSCALAAAQPFASQNPYIQPKRTALSKASACGHVGDETPPVDLDLFGARCANQSPQLPQG